MIWELLLDGITNGFYWFPFVLGVGLLYKNLKTIDVSIDGVAINSIIVFVITWNATGSLLLSGGSTILFAIVCYIVLSILIYEFKINAIFAGVIFTLILYAVSVIAIGESLPLKNNYSINVNDIATYLPIASIIVALLIDLLFRTKMGVSIRVIGENEKANTTYNRRLLLLFGFIITGILVGYGAIGYAIKEHVARSGGGFDFLINSLTSFLLVDKFVDFIISRYKKNNEDKVVKHFTRLSLLQNPVFKAFVGSMLFQITVILIIQFTTNPIYWKLFFGIALILTVARFEFKKNRSLVIKKTTIAPSVSLEHIFFSYNVGYDNKIIFEDFSLQLSPGLNIIRGVNGIGKTTLLKLINGEVTPEKGQITVNANRKNIFYLRQEPIDIFAKELTVYENVINVLPNFKRHKITGVNKLIQIVSEKVNYYNLSFDFLNDKSIWVKTTDSLSGGQLQKIACMMALVSECDIILADEPSSGLDQNNVQTLQKFFYAFADIGKLIIVISHDSRLLSWDAKQYIMTKNKVAEIK